VTTPVASGTLYASVADLRNVMSGTDSGTGTAAQLTDAQLELALYSSSNRVSVYAGNVYDSSSPQAVPPAILHDLTLDLAAFWAAKTYMKNKSVETTSPVYIAYQNAMSLLEDVRDGKIQLGVSAAPGVGEDVGTVINRIPPVFTGRDSNVRIDPTTGVLEADSPFWTARTGGLFDQGGGGPLYQG
jgi:phage gp36-like protein